MTALRYVAEFPRPPAVEPVPEEVRILLAGEVIAQAAPGTTWRVLETTHPPTYYLPADAFRPGVLTPGRPGGSLCEWKGRADYLTVSAGERVERDAAWTYPDPVPAYAMLAGHVAVYAGRMEACFVGDERVTPQPGGFYGGWVTRAFLGPFKGGPGTAFW